MIYDVSIIIISYNNFQLTYNCIKSIYEHTKSVSFEIIVVDNASTEGDIEEYLKDFSVKIIKNNDNLGFAKANNIGLKFAKGNYILFLNNDTLFIENTLKNIFLFSEQINNESLIGCKILNSDKTLQYSVYDFPSLLNIFTSNFFLYLIFPKSKYFNKYHLMEKKINIITKVDVIIGAFIWGNKNFIDKLKGFDEKFFFYAEDTDLCFQARKQNIDTYYYPNTSIIHLKGTAVNKNLWFKYKNESLAQIKIMQKHFPFFKKIIGIFIHFLGILIRIPIFFIIGVLTFKKQILLRGFYYFKLLFQYPKNEFNKSL